MELHELHVDEIGARLVGQRLAVAAVLPGVRGHLVGLADPARREDDRLGREHDRLARRPPVPERARDPGPARDEARDRALHVHGDPGRHGPVLERADHLEAGPVADVGETRVRVAAERALEDPAVGGPVEHGAPQLELADPVRRLGRVELGHPRVVQQLAADHRVAEVHLPRVPGGHVGQRRRDATLGHHRVGLAQQGLAYEADVGPGRLCLDRRAQPRAAGADDQDVVRVGRDLERVDR